MGPQKKQLSPFLLKLPRVNVVTGRLDFILKKCEGKKVLHLGCVDEKMTLKKIERKNLTHFRLLEIAREVWGVDISTKGIELLKEMGVDNLFQGDVEHIDKMEELKGQEFDVVLATEILEHLNNPGLLLQGVKELFSSNTIMIISVPNALQFTAFEYSLRGYEMIHPDHNFWFSYGSLSNLLIKNNYKITEISPYSNLDCEASLIVRNARKIKKRFKKIVFRENNREQSRISSEGNNHLVNSIGRTFSEIIKVSIRRFLYKINPFFADGLIFVVEYKDVD